MNMNIFSLIQKHFKRSKHLRQFFILLLIAGCTTASTFSDKNLKGFVGAADVSTQNVGKNILLNGGNAADAMAAMIINEAVVMPSRVSLSGGGICQVFDEKDGKVKTLDFLPIQVPQTQASLPMLPRGVFALHNQYGIKRWSDVLKEPIHNAQKGILVSDLLARDIKQAKNLPASWKKLEKGNLLVQAELAETLSLMSQSGAGIFYRGSWADDMSVAAFNLGYPYTSENLKTIRPNWSKSNVVLTSKGKTFFPNSLTLSSEGEKAWKKLISLNNFTLVSQGKEELRQMEKKAVENSFYGTSLTASDKNGLTVVCSIGMGNLFGDGMYLKKQGFFLSNGLNPESQYDIVNIIQTNPDETDVYSFISGTGPGALVDGIRLLENIDLAQENLSSSISNVNSEIEDRENTLGEMSLFMCRNGYPNQVSSCQANQNIVPVYSAVNLGN